MQNSRLKRLVAGLMLALLVVGNFGHIEPVQAAVAVLTVTQSSLALSSVTTGAESQEVARFQLAASSAEDIQVTRFAFTVSTTPEAVMNPFMNYVLMSNGQTVSVRSTITSVDAWHQLVTFTGFQLRIPRNQRVPVSLVVDVGSTSNPDIAVRIGLVKSTNNVLVLTAQGVSTGNTLNATGIIFTPSNTIYSPLILVNPTQPVGTLTFGLGGTPGLSALVAVGTTGSGTEVQMLGVTVTPSVEDIRIDRIQFNHILAQGDASANDFAPNGIKLYKSIHGGPEVLIGSTSLVPSTVNAGYAAVFTGFATPLVIHRSDLTQLTVKAVFNGVLTGVPSGSIPNIQLGDGVTPDASLVTAFGVVSGQQLGSGAINGSYTMNIVPIRKVLYRSYPTVWLTGTLGNADHSLANGTENDISRATISATSLGGISLKQLRYYISLIDLGTTVNSLSLGSFRFFRDNTDITNDVSITLAGVNLKAGGASLGNPTGNSLMNKITVRWIGASEEFIPAGTTHTYALKAVPNGFVSDADNDYIHSYLANNQEYILPTSVTHLNYLGTNGVNDISLINSNSTASTSADFVWSDLSASGHSAAVVNGSTGTAALSTGDWFNGYGVSGGGEGILIY